MPSPEILIPIIAFPAFALFWIGVCTLIARFGGWSKLAKEYPYIEAQRPLAGGKSFYVGFFQIDVVGKYNGVTRLTITPEGFLLKTIFIFKFGHHPIFVEWKKIKNITKEDFLLIGTVYRIKLENVELKMSGEGPEELYNEYLKRQK